MQSLDERAIHLLAPVRVLEGREEDARNLASDELLAQAVRVLDADVLLRAVAGAPPEHSVAVNAGEPGDLAADDLEDLRRPQPRDKEPELAMDLGRDLAAHEAARSHS